MARNIITDDIIKEINDKTDIVDLVKQFVSLEKAGANYRGLCPFHNEKTPSFMVSPKKNIATCMGCHEGGSPINFYMKIKNISFKEACIDLASRAGIDLKIDKKIEEGPDYSKYYNILEKTSTFYCYNLYHTDLGLKALEYLHKRGITDTEIKDFNIGLSLDKFDILYHYLLEENINELDMLDLGLIKNSDKGFYDLFQSRIMFPIKDEHGHIVAFSGRIFLDNDKNNAKYLNSPETVIFKKNSILYHLSDALKDIRRKNRVILHEGQLDVISSCKAGFNEAICTLGTALSENHCKILKKYTSNVLICYDGDNAGINAIKKATLLFKKFGFNIECVMLPKGLDPDDFVNKKGAKEFETYLENNKLSLADFNFEYAIKDTNFENISEVEKAKNLLFESLNGESSVLVEAQLKKFSQLTKISYDSIYNDFITSNKKIKNEPKYDEFNLFDTKQEDLNTSLSFNPANLNKAELRIFKYAEQSKERALDIDSRSIKGYTFADCLSNESKDIWIKLINEYYEEYDTYNFSIFLKYLTEEESKNYIRINSDINKLLNESLNRKDLEDCIDAILNQKFINEALNQEKLINSDLSNEDKDKHFKEKVKMIRTLNKNKKDLRR